MSNPVSRDSLKLSSVFQEQASDDAPCNQESAETQDYLRHMLASESAKAKRHQNEISLDPDVTSSNSFMSVDMLRRAYDCQFKEKRYEYSNDPEAFNAWHDHSVQLLNEKFEEIEFEIRTKEQSTPEYWYKKMVNSENPIDQWESQKRYSALLNAKKINF